VTARLHRRSFLRRIMGHTVVLAAASAIVPSRARATDRDPGDPAGYPSQTGDDHDMGRDNFVDNDRGDRVGRTRLNDCDAQGLNRGGHADLVNRGRGGGPQPQWVSADQDGRDPGNRWACRRPGEPRPLRCPETYWANPRGGGECRPPSTSAQGTRRRPFTGRSDRDPTDRGGYGRR
jgi:hypothetical protein